MSCLFDDGTEDSDGRFPNDVADEGGGDDADEGGGNEGSGAPDEDALFSKHFFGLFFLGCDVPTAVVFWCKIFLVLPSWFSQTSWMF